jgi:hypothetical protein
MERRPKMNTKCLTEILKNAQKYAPKKESSLPILNTVKIIINEQYTEIVTTNLEKSFIFIMPNTTLIPEGEKIAVCLPAKTLAELFKTLNQDQPTYFRMVKDKFNDWDKWNHRIIESENEASRVEITNGRSKFELKYIPIDNYPNVIDTTDTVETLRMKYDLTAEIHTKKDEYQPDEYEQQKIESKEVDKKYPKYISIDGTVATKTDHANREYNYNYETHQSTYGEWYCNYTIGDESKMIYLSELPKYDTLKKKGDK